MTAPRFIPAPGLARIDTPAHPRRTATLLTAFAAILAMLLATAMPARALDRDDLAKAIIAGIIIGAIVKEGKRDRRPAPAPEPAPVTRAIPGVCAIDIQGKKRNVVVYSERCIRAEGVTAELPRHCATHARIYGKPDRIYGVDCLLDAGFTVETGRIY